MDSINDPSINEVVVMSCSQIGKTEILLNAIGYYIAYAHAPILVVQPTLEMARAWSQDRLAPMIRDSNILKYKVADVNSKDSGNTVLQIVGLGAAVGGATLIATLQKSKPTSKLKKFGMNVLIMLDHKELHTLER